MRADAQRNRDRLLRAAVEVILEVGAEPPLDAIAQRAGVGIGTLREILCRLSAEALVVAEGQRGFEAPPVRVSELRELGEPRLLLESRALADSFAAGDVEWEGRVVAAHHKLEVSERAMIAGRREEAPAWKRYDWEFHQALISACGSRPRALASAMKAMRSPSFDAMPL